MFSGAAKSSDPYVVVKPFGLSSKKTPVMKKTLNPTWEWTGRWKIDDASALVELVVYDDDWGADTCIGNGSFALAELAHQRATTKWLPLTEKSNGRGKGCGEIQ